MSVLQDSIGNLVNLKELWLDSNQLTVSTYKHISVEPVSWLLRRSSFSKLTRLPIEFGKTDIHRRERITIRYIPAYIH